MFARCLHGRFGIQLRMPLITLKWEPLRVEPSATITDVQRSRVPGGWLIYVCNNIADPEMPSAHGGLTFYPDPEHKWDGASLG